MDVSQIVSIAVFVIVMVAIMTEKLHRSLAAIVGAMLVLALHVLPFDAAMEHIDFNTLGVLCGMMMFVAVVKQSGLFEFVAIWSAKVCKGQPWRIMVAFVLITALFSALLDNVTTILLIGPMTIMLCRTLKIDATPFLIAEIIASNVGGTATLIGDPPNIMIGSAAGLTFFDFIRYDAPIVVVILAVLLIVFKILYGRKLFVDEVAMREVMAAGFPHVNMDLIAGLPEDTPEGFRRSLDEVLSMGADNITVHTLALKKGSRILLEGQKIPSAEAVGQMLDYSVSALRGADFHPYYLYRQKYMSGSFENVGWSRDNLDCLYNIYMMEEVHTILSLGGGGMNKVNLPDGTLRRFHNPKFPEQYIEMLPGVLEQKQELFRLMADGAK